MKKIFLCYFKDLKRKSAIIKWIDMIKDEVIIFVDKNNEIKIFSSICPHFGGNLIYDFKKKVIKCKWHGWEFDTKNGSCLSNSSRTKLNNLPLKIDPQPIKEYKNDIVDEKIYIVLNE